MSNALTAERRNKLAQMLVFEGSVRVGELAEMFDVSTETIRKDLIYLENQGVARKSHGGAIAASELLERPLSEKFMENMELKSTVAKAALEMIDDNSVIMLDSGSTTFQLAKLLTIKKGITVITNSANLPPLLSGTDNTVLSLGGEMRGTSMALVGLWTMNALSSVRVDLAILGSDGFSHRCGPCTPSYAEAEVKKAMMERSKRTIVISDSSKFQKSAIMEFCEWKDIDCLITDDGAPEDQLQEIRANTQVKVVPVK
ncbi:DeoR/GlpR family DNA-binding transcription regulator [Zongyangia hominis]|uniref:Lactose phosphotransferase system repressor n=1 Tax=Zongyangia hominis TaxID=2763677 RepID=A0A926ECB7_9FIRM|nr:DeoR/GlpR family DNA-binding transcription regulator [Zongyangia hominis]MBC8571198.1 DeoR/GlpR transcriptional regulator [Zongyangia hominis]